MTPSLSPTALVPVGKLLLLAGFGLTLVRAMRGGIDLQECFERLAIGFLTLSFFEPVVRSLDGLSQELSALIRRLGDAEDLRRLVLEAFKRASEEGAVSSGSSLPNLPALFEQAWRTGIWGIMSQLVDWFFLIAAFLLECAHSVLWQLLLFLTPLAAGAYPFFPRVLTNLALYALELALWFPILALVEITTALVARNEMQRVGSWGLYVVACELIAILLTLMIPSVTHRFLHGAFSGDLDSSVGIIRWVKSASFAMRRFV
jgi:hypothetical protein